MIAAQSFPTLKLYLIPVCSQASTVFALDSTLPWTLGPLSACLSLFLDSVLSCSDHCGVLNFLASGFWLSLDYKLCRSISGLVFASGTGLIA